MLKHAVLMLLGTSWEKLPAMIYNRHLWDPGCPNTTTSSADTKPPKGMQKKTQPELAGCTGAAVRVLRGKMPLLEMWPQIWWSLFALSLLQPAGLGRSILLKTATTS